MNVTPLLAPVILFSIVLVITVFLRRSTTKKKMERKNVATHEVRKTQKANEQSVLILGANAGAYTQQDQYATSKPKRDWN